MATKDNVVFEFWSKYSFISNNYIKIRQRFVSGRHFKDHQKAL